MGQPLKIAVLASGGGRTLANLQAHIEKGDPAARIVSVIGSAPDLVALRRAAELGLDAACVEPKKHDGTKAFSQAVFDLVRAAGAGVVCLAGWLWLLRIPDDYAHAVINVHPALLPSFGGSGMYGRHVHEAVLAAGCKVSGCTVHFADQTYDTGPIIVQRCCEVREEDSADTLAARVFEQECIAYPQALSLIAQGRLQVEDGRARIG
jgi:phosphoribosylglycinamide formyltransferase-1